MYVSRWNGISETPEIEGLLLRQLLTSSRRVPLSEASVLGDAGRGRRPPHLSLSPECLASKRTPLHGLPDPGPRVYPQSIPRALAWLTCTFSSHPTGFLHWCSPTHPHGFFLVWQDIKMFCLKRTWGRSHIKSPLVLRGLVQPPVANRYPLTLNLALPF